MPDKPLARFSGTALVPGVSKNGRLYSRAAIAKAVERAQQRLAEGRDPITILTHHGAEDDSSRICGHVMSIRLADDGSAKYEAVLQNTPHARTIANLIDTSDGRQPSLRGMSIRGAWVAPVRTVTYEGKPVTTSDDLELDGLDFTRKPGVIGAGVEDFEWTGNAASESASGRVLIYEDAPEAHMEFVESDDVKPELTGYSTELREALINRRNYWRARRGEPVEMWDPATETLVDRDTHIVQQAVAAAVEALASQSGLAVAETAPADSAAATDVTPAISAAPELPAKPFSQMTRDEFAAAAAPHLAGIFDRPRPVGLSPFWAVLVDQGSEDGAK